MSDILINLLIFVLVAIKFHNQFQYFARKILEEENEWLY